VYPVLVSNLVSTTHEGEISLVSGRLSQVMCGGHDLRSFAVALSIKRRVFYFFFTFRDCVYNVDSSIQLQGFNRGMEKLNATCLVYRVCIFLFTFMENVDFV